MLRRRTERTRPRLLQRRRVETSAGAVDVELGWDPQSGQTVTVTTYDERGWDREMAGWNERWGGYEQGETLGEFFTRFLELPPAEGETLAATILGPVLREWKERGGLSAERSLYRWAPLLLPGIALVLALTVVGLVTAVWVVWHEIS